MKGGVIIMVTLDRDMEEQQDVYSSRVFRVSRNCTGYYANKPHSDLRSAVITGKARVRFEDDHDIHHVTCPKFVSEDGWICICPGYNPGVRDDFCSNGNHWQCATYDPSINQYRPIPEKQEK
jgi:hypothetical protein